jgi:hypothetical protein
VSQYQPQIGACSPSHRAVLPSWTPRTVAAKSTQLNPTTATFLKLTVGSWKRNGRYAADCERHAAEKVLLRVVMAANAPPTRKALSWDIPW